MSCEIYVAAATAFLLPLALSAAAADKGWINLDEKRIKAVAGMLVEQPAGFGRPIADRAAWEKLAKHDSYRRVVESAEALLREPIPEQPDELYLVFSRTGNRTKWQRVCSKRRGRVSLLVLAECLENKGRFIPAIEEIIRALCGERTWVMPAHDRSLANFEGKRIDIDLASSALAWNLATANYLLGEKLNEQTRAMIRENVRRRVLDPYREMVKGKRGINWWMRGTNNWNAVCLAGVTGAALTKVQSRDERALFIVAAEAYSRNFLNGFSPDGYCSEGVGYWNYGFGHYVLLSEAVLQATRGGVDFLSREGVRPPATYGARIEIINKVCPAFADCGVNPRPTPHILYFVSRRFGLGLREYDTMDPASSRGYLFDAMMYSFPNSASKTPPAEKRAGGLGLRTWFEQAGVLICRPAEDSEGRFGVAMQGGHNAEHHNHNDVGSYVVVVGGQAVLLDPGSEVYTARTFSKDRYKSNVLNSYGHPVPVVAGQLQISGRQARGEIVRTEFTNDADTLVIDMRSAYKVDGLRKLQRTFVYARKGTGSFTVTDEVAFDKPRTFGTALITLGRWRRDESGSLIVYDTEEAVRVDVRAEGAEYEISSEEIKEDVTAPRLPTRIGISLKKPVTSGSITVVITPLPMGGRRDGVLLRNGGFEEGDWAWKIRKNGMGSLSTERSAGGKVSLKILDTSREKGSSISSACIPIEKPGAFELRGKVLTVSGSGVGLYMIFLDKNRQVLNPRDHRGYIDSVGTARGKPGTWQAFAFPFQSLKGTAYLQVWIHSANGIETESYLDDLEIVRVGQQP